MEFDVMRHRFSWHGKINQPGRHVRAWDWTGPGEAELEKAYDRRVELELTNQTTGFAPYRNMGVGRLELVERAKAKYFVSNPDGHIDGGLYHTESAFQDHTRTVEFGGGVERRVCVPHICHPTIGVRKFPEYKIANLAPPEERPLAAWRLAIEPEPH
jgi:hypothetical protein